MDPRTYGPKGPRTQAPRTPVQDTRAKTCFLGHKRAARALPHKLCARACTCTALEAPRPQGGGQGRTAARR